MLGVPLVQTVACASDVASPLLERNMCTHAGTMHREFQSVFSPHQGVVGYVAKQNPTKVCIHAHPLTGSYRLAEHLSSMHKIVTCRSTARRGAKQQHYKRPLSEEKLKLDEDRAALPVGGRGGDCQPAARST